MEKETNEKINFFNDKKKLTNILIGSIIVLVMCVFGFLINAGKNLSTENTTNVSSSETLNQSKNQNEKNEVLAEKEKQIESLKQENEKLNEQITDLNGKVKNLETQKVELENKIQSLQKQQSQNQIKNSNSTSNNSYNDNSSETVYITNTGSKYHRSGCSYLKSSIKINKSEAIKRGYTPCSRCNP